MQMCVLMVLIKRHQYHLLIFRSGLERLSQVHSDTGMLCFSDFSLLMRRLPGLGMDAIPCKSTQLLFTDSLLQSSLWHVVEFGLLCS